MLICVTLIDGDSNTLVLNLKNTISRKFLYGNDIATARRGLGSSGSSTSGLVFGGDNPSKNAQTESFDGTSFTEVNDLATARAYGATGGITSATAALFAGGQTLTNVTEEWNAADFQIKSVTTS